MSKGKKPEIITGEDLWALAVLNGIDVEKPVGGNMLIEAGLGGPFRRLSATAGSRQNALKAAGFKPLCEARNERMASETDEKTLRAQLLAYIGGDKRKPVSIRELVYDRSGQAKPGSIPGNKLAFRLRKFAEQNKVITRHDGTKEYGRTATDTIKYFGFKLREYHPKEDDLLDELRALWPKTMVELAYAGKTQLPRIADLKKNKRLQNLFSSVRAKGTARMINSLYSEFPDMQNYVCDQKLTPANPEILRKQLRDAFYAQKNLSTAMKQSTEFHERKLYWRVMSLQEEPGFGARIGKPSLFGKPVETKPAKFNQILGYLLPEFSGQELSIEPGAIKRQGTVGELFTSWMLHWSAAINPNGFGDERFRKLFGLHHNVIYAERHLDTDNKEKRKAPDFTLYGQDHAFVEVRTGENARHAESLVTKYAGQMIFNFRNLEPITNPKLVAVLHMPKKALKEAAPKLLDAGWEVVVPDQFVGWLERIVKKAPADMVAEAVPRVNIPSVIDAYNRLVQSPISFARPGGDYEMRFLKSTLESLVHYDFEHVAS